MQLRVAQFWTDRNQTCDYKRTTALRTCATRV